MPYKPASVRGTNANTEAALALLLYATSSITTLMQQQSSS
jgi:hypothetical protein